MKANDGWVLIPLLLLLSTPAILGAQAHKVVRAEYYGEIGCSHCDDFADTLLPSAEEKTGVRVELDSFDILSTEGYERCKNRLADLGYEFSIFPVLILGNNVYQGNSAIEANLEAELSHYARAGVFRPRIQDKSGSAPSPKLTAIPIFVAGLVDGINPCAFTTLLFFLSFLSLRGGTRKRMAAAGLSFAAGVFLAYFLIGMGLFNVIRTGARIASLRLVLRILISAATAVFCVLTLLDIRRMRRGKPSDMRLQLPGAVKRLIHASIRHGIGTAALPLGAFATGVVVSVLELACTGQVYFPTISFMVQTDHSWMGVGGLLLYNLAFILPLLAVLALIVLGVSQEALRTFFERHVILTKAALALVFASMTALIWMY